MKNSIFLIIILLIIIIFSFSIKPTISQFYINQSKLQSPGISKKTLESHIFQQYVENLFAINLRFRKNLIFINNQLYYYLWKKSFAENGTLVVGKNNQLFEYDYVIDYCKNTKNVAALIDWANKLSELNLYFNSRGKIFIYIITPSKAEYMPENIPERFHCRNNGIKNEIYYMDKLLQERNIIHINGPELMSKARQAYPIPMFPPGGTHWNWLGATIEAAAIVDVLRPKIAFPELKYIYTMHEPHLGDTDRDIASIAVVKNKIFNRKVPHVQFVNAKYQGKPLRLSLIGGSFNISLNAIFIQNNLFDEINYYFYFNHLESISKMNKKSGAHSSINISTILNSDVIILEENSSLIVSDHGKRFYEKILQA